MGRIINGVIMAGVGAGIFVAGNVSPDIFNKSEAEPTARVKADASAIAQNCGATAMKDVLAKAVEPKMTAGQIQETAQHDVATRMNACFDQYVTQAVAGVINSTGVPKVDVQMHLVSTEGKG